MRGLGVSDEYGHCAFAGPTTRKGMAELARRNRESARLWKGVCRLAKVDPERTRAASGEIELVRAVIQAVHAVRQVQRAGNPPVPDHEHPPSPSGAEGQDAPASVEEKTGEDGR